MRFISLQSVTCRFGPSHLGPSMPTALTTLIITDRALQVGWQRPVLPNRDGAECRAQMGIVVGPNRAFFGIGRRFLIRESGGSRIRVYNVCANVVFATKYEINMKNFVAHST